MLETPKAPRRTQDQRSARTREALHQATIESLMEVGYAKTSTSGITKRAGVSRGAQTHHYPEKIDLVVAATDDMFNGFSDEVEQYAAGLRSGQLTFETFLDKVWSQMLSGNWFYSSLEMIVAARGDAELQARLQPLILELHGRFEDIWKKTFESCDGSDPVVAFNAGMNMLRGMAVQAVLRPDENYHHDMMAALLDMLQSKIRPIRE